MFITDKQTYLSETEEEIFRVVIDVNKYKKLSVRDIKINGKIFIAYIATLSFSKVTYTIRWYFSIRYNVVFGARGGLMAVR